MSITISLDYDDTFTKDPVLWRHFSRDARQRGHRVVVCTMRYEGQESVAVIKSLGDIIPSEDFYFTGRQLKREFMESRGVKVDIWIDDKPEYIVAGVPLL